MKRLTIHLNRFEQFEIDVFIKGKVVKKKKIINTLSFIVNSEYEIGMLLGRYENNVKKFYLSNLSA